jgi:hypothetical protein
VNRIGEGGFGSVFLAELIWSLVVFAFPLIGLIIWFFAGPKKG